MPPGLVDVIVRGTPLGLKLPPSVEAIFDNGRGTSRYGTRSVFPPPVSTTLPLTWRNAALLPADEAVTLSVAFSVASPPAGTFTLAAPNVTVAADEPGLATNDGVNVTAGPSFRIVIGLVIEKLDPSSAKPKLRLAVWNAATPTDASAGAMSPSATTCVPTAAAGRTRPLPPRVAR